MSVQGRLFQALAPGIHGQQGFRRHCNFFWKIFEGPHTAGANRHVRHIATSSAKDAVGTKKNVLKGRLQDRKR